MKGAKLYLTGGAALGLIAYLLYKDQKAIVDQQWGKPMIDLAKGGERDVDRDPNHLLPGFRQKLERVFWRMKKRGFKPALFEGLRSPARAKRLNARGTGIEKSMHIYGIAADVVDAEKLHNASPQFWAALGEEAEREGLTWGGRWLSKRRPEGDRPHVQYIPVSMQDTFIAMSEAERKAYVT